MISKNYKHIFFDLDRTLWDFELNSEIAMKLCLEELNIYTKIQPFNIYFSNYQKINEQLWEEYRKGITNKTELSQRRFLESLSPYNINNNIIEQANDCYIKHMGKQFVLIQGSVELLNALKAKKYNLHIITNGFTQVQNSKLYNSNVSHYFSSVTTSEMAGVAKPDKKIFEYALKNTNAKKNQSIMIGDDWQNDILGAINFGIDAIYFNNQAEIIIPNETELIANSELKFKQNNKCNCFYTNKILNILEIIAKK